MEESEVRAGRGWWAMNALGVLECSGSHNYFCLFLVRHLYPARQERWAKTQRSSRRWPHTGVTAARRADTFVTCCPTNSNKAPSIGRDRPPPRPCRNLWAFTGIERQWFLHYFANQTANHWNTILLLDEADVFLEQRLPNYLTRNGLVSVFLRKLECYQGIHFLTINRVSHFDVAILSQIHLVLRYYDLTKDARGQVWRNFLSWATTSSRDSDVTAKELEELARDKLNGRHSHSREIVLRFDVVVLLPFRQKVVNKWFHNRTILIGDAAHVFPPFGGQGIACGISDAHALAWRLAVLEGIPSVSNELREGILKAWSSERRKGVHDSARLTKVNGQLTNEMETWWFYLFRKALAAASDLGLYNYMQWSQAGEIAGYKGVNGGFFLKQYGGGGKLAQIYVLSDSQDPFLSDDLLKRDRTVMTLLVSGENESDEVIVKKLLQESKVPATILSSNSIVVISSNKERTSASSYSCCHQEDLIEQKLRPGYESTSFIASLPPGTRYAIVRPDFIVFAAAKSLEELRQCCAMLSDKLRL